MRYQISAFILLLFLQMLSSCQDDVCDTKEKNIDSLLNAIQTKSGGYDIDGGYLPEVVVTAHYLPREDSDTGGYYFEYWWYPYSETIPPSGGGGGGGSSQSSTVSVSEGLVKLFPKGADLSEDDLTKLNEVYKEMMQHCEWAALNKMLLNSDRQGGKIQMSSSQLPGTAGTDMGNGDLTLYESDLINAEHICHEWIHLCQSYLFPPDEFVGDFKDYEGMCEFQLVLILDLIQFVKEGTFYGSDNDAEFPKHTSWISSLDMDDEKKFKDLELKYRV